MCCYSCWLPTPLWRRTEWWTEMKWGTLCSQKTGRAGLQIVRYSQELILWVQFLFSSVQLLSLVRILATPWNAACQASPSITNPRAYSYSCLSSWWCHPTISSSVVPFSSHLKSFSASRSFQMSQFFKSGGQNIGVSASVSVLSMNIQECFLLELTCWSPCCPRDS